MSTRSLAAAAAALLCFMLPARAQQPGADFPEGAGKQAVVNLCGGCHDINRVKIGYTPEGWHTVMRMMLNIGAPVPKDQVETVTEYLIKSFPERPRPGRQHHRRAGAGHRSSSGRLPTPGSRPHDPLAIERRRDLVHRATRRHARPARPGHRPDQGVPAQDAAHRPARACRGQGRQHLVHRQPHAIIGKLDPKTGNVTEYPMPDPEGEGPAHAQLRPERHPVVHGAGRQHGRPARPQDRRDQAVHARRRRTRGPMAS